MLPKIENRKAVDNLYKNQEGVTQPNSLKI